MELEAIIVALELINEVTIASSIGTAYHRNMLTEQWEFQFLLKIEDPFLLQLFDYSLPFACHIAQSVGRVDVAYYP